MKIEIKNRYNGSVLFAYEAEGNTLAITLRMAIAANANLYGANFCCADLRDAYFAGAYFAGADFAGANLRGTDFASAYLRDVNFAGAELHGAYLRGFKLIGERPLTQVGPIGSRGDYMLAYITDDGIKIQAGCFFGGVDAFESAVNETHGESDHGKEYRAAIAFVRTHAEIWTPTFDKSEAEESKS